MNNRRRDVRVPEQRRIRVRVLNPQQGDVPGAEISGTTTDLSGGGACIECDHALPRQGSIELSFNIEGFPSDFLHWAEVRWSEYDSDRGVFRMGLEFTRVSAHGRDVWTSFIESLRRRDARRTGVVPAEM